MTAICTNTEVFEFCGTAADVVVNQGSAVTALIANVQEEVEKIIGRKITSTSFSNVLFQDGLNCEILGQKLFLKGKYRDVYSISAISENATALTTVADYDDGNDYYLDSRLGVIHRKGVDWSVSEFGIKISGSLGLGGEVPLLDIKQAVIEMVAAKSGLWKINVESEGGTITSVRTTPTSLTMRTIQKYKLRDM